MLTLRKEFEDDHQRNRRQLLRQYLRLQRELLNAGSPSSCYQSSTQAFRQISCALINSGFEADLDRLLRIRVIEGGRNGPTPRAHRILARDLRLLKERVLS